MLEFIRERAQGFLAWVIVIGLILSFALWGIGEYLSPDSEVYVATVNGEQITSQEFQSAYQQQRSRLQNMLGENFNPALFDSEQMKNDVLEQMIERRLLLQLVTEQGLRVSDQQVAAAVRAIPQLQNEGRFDAQRYRRLLAAQGISVEQFETGVRGDLVLTQLRRGVMDSALVAEAEVDTFLRLREQKRDLGFMLIPYDRFVDGIELSDAELQSYYQEHKDQFEQPEQVRIAYLELSVAGLAEHVSVSEEEVRAEYQQRLKEFTVPEQRRARHLLVQVASDAAADEVDAARQKAAALLARVQAGESFGDLAREYSDDPGSASKGGDLGYFGRGIMDKSFEEAVFGLQPGQLAPEPVRSAFGYHIIKLEDVRGGDTQPFAAVRERLAAELKRQQAEQIFFDQLEQLSNLSFENPDNLTVAAEALGLEVQTSPWFSRDKGSALAENPLVREAAFSEDVLAGGNNSEPLELAPDRVVVLRVSEHRPRTTPPLDEVREQVRARLSESKAAAAAKVLGETLLGKLRAGASPEAVAGEQDLVWEHPGLVGRNESGYDSEVLQAAFRASRPEGETPVWQGQALASGDYAVLAVFEVQDGNAAMTQGALRKSISAALLQERGRSEFNAYLDALKAGADIKRFPDNLQVR
ncbi:MAG TPA: peptidylprolyl isomerase [Gammaproteobacteria bacterium]|nr:peptidylprolyl isomerase [Gammaproteobacteria bacterium]